MAGNYRSMTKSLVVHNDHIISLFYSDAAELTFHRGGTGQVSSCHEYCLVARMSERMTQMTIGLDSKFPDKSVATVRYPFSAHPGPLQHFPSAGKGMSWKHP